MRKLLLMIGLIAFIATCSAQDTKSLQLKHKNNKDLLEYELLIFDTGFDSWFITKDNESNKRSIKYYELKNQIYVSEWNRLHRTGRREFDCSINYESTTNYGFNLNYKLYMYFKYFEEKNKIKLIHP